MDIYISTARKYLALGVPVYCTHVDGSRFRVIRIGTKYITTVNGQKVLRLDVNKYDLG
jgi:hypothetical protein